VDPIFIEKVDATGRSGISPGMIFSPSPPQETNIDAHKIIEISFTGEGCAISKASTSMMVERLKGLSIEQAKELFKEFQLLLLKKIDPQKESHNLGKLEVFKGIWQYPSRVKCAGLAWHTLNAALNEDNQHLKPALRVNHLISS